MGGEVIWDSSGIFLLQYDSFLPFQPCHLACWMPMGSLLSLNDSLGTTIFPHSWSLLKVQQQLGAKVDWFKYVMLSRGIPKYLTWDLLGSRHGAELLTTHKTPLTQAAYRLFSFQLHHLPTGCFSRRAEEVSGRTSSTVRRGPFTLLFLL